MGKVWDVKVLEGSVLNEMHYGGRGKGKLVYASVKKDAGGWIGNLSDMVLANRVGEGVDVDIRFVWYYTTWWLRG